MPWSGGERRRRTGRRVDALGRRHRRDDPAAAFEAAYDDGDVTVRGVTPVRFVVVEVMKVFVDVGRFLGL